MNGVIWRKVWGLWTRMFWSISWIKTNIDTFKRAFIKGGCIHHTVCWISVVILNYYTCTWSRHRFHIIFQLVQLCTTSCWDWLPRIFFIEFGFVRLSNLLCVPLYKRFLNFSMVLRAYVGFCVTARFFWRNPFRAKMTKIGKKWVKNGV